jgi:hypothetical protein
MSWSRLEKTRGAGSSRSTWSAARTSGRRSRAIFSARGASNIAFQAGMSLNSPERSEK